MSASRQRRRAARMSHQLINGRSDDDKLKRAIAQFKKTGTCGVCGGKAHKILILFPTEDFQRRLHAPPDKDRVVITGLCPSCDRPGAVEICEANLLRHADSMRDDVGRN